MIFSDFSRLFSDFLDFGFFFGGGGFGFLWILEGTARYASLLLAPAEGFRRANKELIMLFYFGPF